MLADIRYAIRTLRRSPAFTATAILTLALGIGANTAIFSIVNAVLIRPLPYPEAERLVQIFSVNQQRAIGQIRASALDFFDWRQRARAFERMGAHIGTGYTFTGDAEPELVTGQLVTEDLLPALGVRPAIGRLFDAADFESGNEHVLILSDGLWRRRFGADPGLVGRVTTVNGMPYTIVGVMPPGFEYPSKRYQLWAPFPTRPGPELPPINRGSRYLQVVGRLRPGVSRAQAQADMDAVASSLESEYPDTNARLGARVVSLSEQLVGGVRPALLALLGAVGFVVLVACANVTSLLLARATGRTREVAIRAALGAGAWRLVRQMLAETLILYAAGGLAATAAASWALAALMSLSPGDIPRLDQTSLDGRVLAFTAIVSLLTGLVFGLVPASLSARPRLSDTLKTSARSASASRASQRLRGILVVGEVALSVVLLVGATLATRSFLRLTHVDAGFEIDDQLTFGVAPPPARYGDAPALIAFHRQLLDTLGSAPGVRLAGTTTHLPLSGQNLENRFEVDGRDERPNDPVVAGMRGVSPGYFAAMGIEIRRGRVFTSDDRMGAAPVAIVTQGFARRYIEGDPIGRRVREGGLEEWRTIVGVADDVKHNALREEMRPDVYLPYEQLEPSFMLTWARGLRVILRGPVTPAALVAVARERVHAVDPLLALTEVETVADLASQSIAEPRFRTVLLALFAGLALTLATIGVGGVMSYFVSQRTQEIGIRMALGASRSDVLILVVGRGIGLALAGIASGVAAAVPLVRWRADLLFEVTPFDPLTLAGVGVAVFLVAGLASYLPARRAAGVEPMQALRIE